MLTVVFLLAISAFICTIASAAFNKCPLWIAVLLLCVIALIQAAVPLGR